MIEPNIVTISSNLNFQNSKLKMTEKYQLANANKGGAAYNILNLAYDKPTEGQYLKQRDHDKEVRSLLRSKNIDMLSNSGNNVLNGDPRRQVEVPTH